MYHFEVNVQASLEAAAIGEGELETQESVRARLSAVQLPIPPPLSISFEEAADRLQRLPRLFFEPDGSFVWVGQQDGNRWQVDGQLFDRAGQLLYAELKGCCPPPALDQILGVFGWPTTALTFQLIQQGVFLDEAQFRRFAEKRDQ